MYLFDDACVVCPLNEPFRLEPFLLGSFPSPSFLTELATTGVFRLKTCNNWEEKERRWEDIIIV